MTDNIKGCPFDGDDQPLEHGIEIVEEFIEGVFYISCMCGATGPKRSTPELAFEAWQSRAAGA